MVISTGTTWPAWLAVRSLYSLTNCMMLTAWGPNPVPTGGAGVALPAGSCSLTIALTLLAIYLFHLVRLNPDRHWHAERVDPDLHQVAFHPFYHAFRALVAAARQFDFVAFLELRHPYNFSTCRKS